MAAKSCGSRRSARSSAAQPVCSRVKGTVGMCPPPQKKLAKQRGLRVTPESPWVYYIKNTSAGKPYFQRAANFAVKASFSLPAFAKS